MHIRILDNVTNQFWQCYTELILLPMILVINSILILRLLKFLIVLTSIVFLCFSKALQWENK